MLHECTKQLIRNQVADFAEKLITHAIEGDNEGCLQEMTSFYEFFCGALTVALRDARKSDERVSVN